MSSTNQNFDPEKHLVFFGSNRAVEDEKELKEAVSQIGDIVEINVFDKKNSGLICFANASSVARLATHLSTNKRYDVQMSHGQFIELKLYKPKEKDKNFFTQPDGWAAKWKAYHAKKKPLTSAKKASPSNHSSSSSSTPVAAHISYAQIAKPKQTDASPASGQSISNGISASKNPSSSSSSSSQVVQHPEQPVVAAPSNSKQRNLTAGAIYQARPAVPTVEHRSNVDVNHNSAVNLHRDRLVGGVEEAGLNIVISRPNIYPGQNVTFVVSVSNPSKKSKKLLSLQWHSKSHPAHNSNLKLSEQPPNSNGWEIKPKSTQHINLEFQAPKRPTLVRYILKLQIDGDKPIYKLLSADVRSSSAPNFAAADREELYRPDINIQRLTIPVRPDGVRFKDIAVIVHQPHLGPEIHQRYALTSDRIDKVERTNELSSRMEPRAMGWTDRLKYKEMMHHLLYTEELEQKRRIRNYDLPRTSMTLVEDQSIRDPLLSIAVGSLSERKPSLTKGDRCFAWVFGTNDFEYEGYVHATQKDHILVAFAEVFHREVWNPNQQFTVRFETDRQPFLIHHMAVDSVHLDVVWPEINQIRNYPSSKIEKEIQVSADQLNDPAIAKNPNQLKVVALGLNRKTLATPPVPLLLFGPFGTGKTKVLAELIFHVLKKRPNSRILITAPSNSAADVFTTFLQLNQSEPMLRLYAQHRLVPGNLEGYTYRLPGFGNAIPPLEDLMSYRIIITTCAFSICLTDAGVPQGHFSHIIIDEAGQNLEPDVLCPLTLADPSTAVIMAGDPLQLGPRFQNNHIIRQGLSCSIMERLFHLPLYTSRSPDGRASYNANNLIHLSWNYRSHPKILEFASKEFYNAQLESKVDMSGLPPLDHWELIDQSSDNPGAKFPLLFHHTAGIEAVEPNSPSFYNYEEARIICMLIQDLLGDPAASTLNQNDIGVIAPFYRQQQLIRQMLRRLSLGDVMVNSIAEMQGKEYKAIFMTTVRSSLNYIQRDLESGIGFIGDSKALNTAITRARCLVVVVGHQAVLENDPSWHRFLNECTLHGTFINRMPDGAKEEWKSYANNNMAPTTKYIMQELDKLYAEGDFSINFSEQPPIQAHQNHNNINHQPVPIQPPHHQPQWYQQEQVPRNAKQPPGIPSSSPYHNNNVPNGLSPSFVPPARAEAALMRHRPHILLSDPNASPAFLEYLHGDIFEVRVAKFGLDVVYGNSKEGDIIVQCSPKNDPAILTNSTKSMKFLCIRIIEGHLDVRQNDSFLSFFIHPANQLPSDM